MSDGEDRQPTYFYIQVHGRLLGDTPVCCLHLTRQGDEDPTHTMILTLDQADGLQADMEVAKIAALNAYIQRRAAFNELATDLEAWKDLKLPEDEVEEDE